jgi:hypothetical protein
MTFSEMITFIHQHTAGWIAYYGRFYKSALYAAFQGLDAFLVKWAMRNTRGWNDGRSKPGRNWSGGSRGLIVSVG